MDVFEIKTPINGRMPQRQLERYVQAMGGQRPVKVQVPLRQRRLGTAYELAEDASAVRKMRTLGMATVGGVLLFNTCMALADEQEDEDVAWQQLEITVNRYRRAHDIGLKRLELTQLTDDVRRWLTAATGDPNAAAIATEVFARAIVDQLWQ